MSLESEFRLRLKKLKIGSLELENNVILAPMAGVTDKAFRLITKPFGPALMYTEMVSGKGLLYKNRKTEVLLEVLTEEKPTAAQIFGHEPDVMAAIAENALKYGAEMIDINMGCPAPKIVNNGDGSALMKTPELAGEIIKSVKKAVDCPVSVKFRTGWDESRINAVEFAKIAEDSGADALTVHGRTREQFYSGKANLDIIKQVKEAVSVPVIGNGDIHNGISAAHMLSYTGCDGIMVGRAAQGNPWIFSEIISYLRDGTIIIPPTLEERSETAIRHLKLLTEFKGEHRGVLEGRKHTAWYFKGFEGGARLRNAINQCCTLDEMLDIISMENLSQLNN